LSFVRIRDAGKRLVLGRKLRSTALRQQPLPKRIALPVFSSDPLSSVAYSPDEIFLILALGGVAAYSYSWKIALAIAFVMLVVVTSYRQTVRAYQSGGGDYEVAHTNLGSNFGLTAASALLVDYVLLVSVSISSATQYVASAIEPARGHQVGIALGIVALLTALNLRGVRESRTAFAVPTYLFMGALIVMILWGFWQHFLGDGLPKAPSAELEIVPTERLTEGLTGLAFAFLLLRAFSSGCATLTGVQTIANGVPSFKPPRGRNAATTLWLLGAIAVSLLVSVVVLARITDVRLAEDPEKQLRGPDGEMVGEDFHQQPLVGQLARTIFDDFAPGFMLVAAATVVILALAANTAFKGFPVLSSILAKDGYLPRQLHTRGDRLAFSNGILALAVFAVLLIWAFDAEVTRLIQVYIVGVFVSFTVSQAGMVRHWSRQLRHEAQRRTRVRMQRSRVINACGFLVTSVVLVVVLVTKFTRGAWIAVLAMAIWFLLMKGIRHHYTRVGTELAVTEDDQLLPSRVHAIVLVSRLHKPTMRALAYARASRANVLEAVSVDVDHDTTAELMDDWDRLQIPVPLRVLSSPYREVTRPIVDYVQSIRRGSPRDVVTVYIPEYVVGHWWEQILHNQSALRLKGRLLFTPGVMVTSVPFQLASADAIRPEHVEPPRVRRRPDGSR